jgi:N-acetylmuramoyl-L-alanine amidase
VKQMNSMRYGGIFRHCLNNFKGLLLLVCVVTANDTAVWAAKPIIATAIEIISKGDTTRFSAELTAETGFSATVMSDPYRVVIDLANVSFDLAAGAGHKGQGLIRQVRYGIIEKGKSRIVIDTEGPVLITQSQLLPRKGKTKARIAIDLVATTPETFAATTERDDALAKANAAETVTASLPTIPAQAVATATTPFQKQAGRRLIVIDPGHGGMDPGAVSANNTKEKDVVFAFARDLQTVLQQASRHDVVLTRETDRYMSLTDRVAFARRSQADLFIAIHADTIHGQSVNGTTIYTLSDTASDEEAAALALAENRADIIAGVDLGHQIVEVADILIDLVQRESKNHANLFSNTAVAELKDVTSMTGKPIRSAGFVVLKAPDVPSVLIELGYLSSKSDEKKLKSEAWRKAMAAALLTSIDKYFAALDAVE